MPVETIPYEPPDPSWDQAAANQDQPAPIQDDVTETADQPDEASWSAAGAEVSRRRSRSPRRLPRRRRGGSLGGWAVFVLCVLFLVIGLGLGRQQIMAWAPETEPLYTLVGLAESRPMPPLPAVQLRLQEVTSGRRQVNGTSELIIEGHIFNPTDRPQDVPPLVATLMDPTGIELKRWVFAAETRVLPPGGRVAFHTSTPDPPGQGNLNLNFVPQRP